MPSDAKARRELSGETRGEIAMVAEVGDGVLVGAVVVHHPDLFVVGAEDFDVVDLGLGDAGRAAAEAEDDLVGKLVGDLAGGVVAWVLVVLLGEDLRDTAGSWRRRESR